MERALRRVVTILVVSGTLALAGAGQGIAVMFAGHSAGSDQREPLTTGTLPVIRDSVDSGHAHSDR